MSTIDAAACSIRKQLRAVVVLTALASAAHGTPVIWGAATGISGNADVSTAGALVAAYNFAGPQTTVNGVAFAAWALGAATIDKGSCPVLPATGTYAAGAHSLTYSLNNCLGDNIGERDTSSAAAPFSSLSADYRSLLGTAGSRGEKDITLTLGGLSLGQSYEIQIWVNDSQSYIPPGFTYPLTLDNLVDLDPNTSVGEGGIGQYVLGTFVADGTTQAVNLFGGEVGIFNGFQLRAVSPAQVPEPTSAGLVALGLLGLLATPRRSRRRT